MEQKKTKKAPTKSNIKPKKKQQKFNHADFVFKTKMKYVYDWMQYMEDELNDPTTEWLDGETYDLYATWLRDENYYRANNIPYTLLSARERYIMGIFNPETKTSKDDGDKP